MNELSGLHHLFKNKYSRMLHHEKPKTLQLIIKGLWCLCERHILYKYQIPFIVLIPFTLK
jgi:hypothetical protein